MAVIEPVKGRKEKTLPSCGVLLVNPSEAKRCIENGIKNGAERRFLFNSSLCVFKGGDENMGESGFFLAGPAIGAPVAVMVMEKLIALGARRIILCGWCGAVSVKLAVGDVLVPLRARIGEGTSQYYRHNYYRRKEREEGGKEQESMPHQQFSQNIALRLAGENIAVHQGCVWSTDAIYREEREYLLQLHRDYGVDAVDMEFSALCSAAAFRGIEFAAVLVVSDLTYQEQWQPGQKSGEFRRRTEQILSLFCDGGFLHSINKNKACGGV